jgi:hypothetical protein
MLIFLIFVGVATSSALLVGGLMLLRKMSRQKLKDYPGFDYNEGIH